MFVCVIGARKVYREPTAGTRNRAESRSIFYFLFSIFYFLSSLLSIFLFPIFYLSFYFPFSIFHLSFSNCYFVLISGVTRSDHLSNDVTNGQMKMENGKWKMKNRK